MEAIQFLKELSDQGLLKSLSYHRINEVYMASDERSQGMSELRSAYMIYGSGLIPFPVAATQVVVEEPKEVVIVKEVVVKEDDPIEAIEEEIAPIVVEEVIEESIEEVVEEVITIPKPMSIMDLIKQNPPEIQRVIMPEATPVQEVVEVVIPEPIIEEVVAVQAKEVIEEVVEEVAPVEDYVAETPVVPEIVIPNDISNPILVVVDTDEDDDREHYTIDVQPITGPTEAIESVTDVETTVDDSDFRNKSLTNEDGSARRVVYKYTEGDIMPELPGMMPTGTKFDAEASDRITTEEDRIKYKELTGEDMPDELIFVGGFTRKCCDITAGGAGSGKTTNLCNLVSLAKEYALREEGKILKVGFVSAEMRDSEWAKELATLPMLKNLEVTFMLDYAGNEGYERIFYDAIADADIVVVDSFPAVLTHIRMNPREKRSEKVLINDLIAGINKSVKENNNSVQLINQATKDGNYKGGTDLPHMMTSLAFVKIEGEQRHWTYVKNRNNGKVNRKLFFNRDVNNCIEFDVDAYDLTYAPRQDRTESIEELLGLTSDFSLEEERPDLDLSKDMDDTEDVISQVAALNAAGASVDGYVYVPESSAGARIDTPETVNH